MTRGNSTCGLRYPAREPTYEVWKQEHEAERRLDDVLRMSGPVCDTNVIGNIFG
jgi:hypothetical protein